MPAAASRKRCRVAAPTFGAALLALALSGCVHHHHHPGRQAPGPPQVYEAGPPPWAPAHGHRRKHHKDVELVFRTELGVYVVVGHDDHYFYEDRYYRYVDGGWQIAISLDGPWGVAKLAKLPPGLQKYNSKKHGKKHRGRGHGPPASMR